MNPKRSGIRRLGDGKRDLRILTVPCRQGRWIGGGRGRGRATTAAGGEEGAAASPPLSPPPIPGTPLFLEILNYIIETC